MEVTDCAHGETRGPRFCALCRHAGLVGRDQGTKQVEQNNAEWSAQAATAIRTLAGTGQPFTAEDVVELIGHPDGSPNAIGAALLRASKTGLIYTTGTRQASRPTSHARQLAIWRGARKPDEDTDRSELRGGMLL